MELGLTRELAEQQAPEVEDAPNVPYCLALGHQMARWNTLLVDGGLLDQPACLLRDIEAALDEEATYLTAQARLQNSARE